MGDSQKWTMTSPLLVSEKARHLATDGAALRRVQRLEESATAAAETTQRQGPRCFTGPRFKNVGKTPPRN